MAQCSARSKRTHEQCRAPAMHGKTVCYHHGGKTPTGFGLPQTKTGRYSKVLPLRLAARYEEALANKDLLSLRDDIAIAESRLGELLGSLDTGESGALWRRLRRTFDTFTAAHREGDTALMRKSLVALRTLIQQGSADAQQWQEIMGLWESRCKLIATEQKTLVAAQQMVTVQQLMVYFGVITDAIQRIVPIHADPVTARAILGDLSTEFARISAGGHGAEA